MFIKCKNGRVGWVLGKALPAGHDHPDIQFLSGDSVPTPCRATKSAMAVRGPGAPPFATIKTGCLTGAGAGRGEAAPARPGAREDPLWPPPPPPPPQHKFLSHEGQRTGRHDRCGQW